MTIKRVIMIAENSDVIIPTLMETAKPFTGPVRLKCGVDARQGNQLAKQALHRRAPGAGLPSDVFHSSMHATLRPSCAARIAAI